MAENPQQLYEIANGIIAEKLGPVLHVRVLGRSRDIAMDVLSMTASTPDETIKEAVAQFMEISPAVLRDTVIERHVNGNITVRPEAVFG